MVLLKTCCCGFLSLKFGTIAIGFLNLIFGLCSLIGTAVTDISDYYSRLEDLKKQHQKEMDKTVSDQLDVLIYIFSSTINLVTGLLVFVYLIYLANSCLLIYGAWKEKKMFLLPWMGWHYSSIIIQTLMMIVFFWFFSLVGFNGIMLAYVLVLSFAHFIVIFFFLVVYSHFQELSEKEDSKPPNYSIY